MNDDHSRITVCQRKAASVTVNDLNFCIMTDERYSNALQLLLDHPDMSQREFDSELGVSLGAVNHCVKALIERGWVKLKSFQRNPRTLRRLNVLKPKGIAVKARLTANLLKRKLEEYAALERQIAELKAEVEQ